MPTVVTPKRARVQTALSPKRARAADKHDRFSARLTAVQKDILQQAAEIEGRTLTEFVLVHAQEAAQKAIRERAILRLNERDSIALAQALGSPWEPSQELRVDIRTMRDLFGDD